jgi:hypothetical protein
MRLRLVLVLCVAWIAPALAAPVGVEAVLAAPLLNILNVYGENNNLCVDFYLKDALDRELIQGMRNGIPTLLSYKVDVWLDRPNWYDKLVKSVRYSYRMKYDNWDTLYTVDAVTEDRHEVISAGDVAELVHLVCNQQRMKTCRLNVLDPGRSYYVTISAEIEALSAERIREIDSWLGGEGESKESGGGGGMLGFVIGIFTPGSKTAETKSSIFRLEGLTG